MSNEIEKSLWYSISVTMKGFLEHEEPEKMLHQLNSLEENLDEVLQSMLRAFEASTYREMGLSRKKLRAHYLKQLRVTRKQLVEKIERGAWFITPRFEPDGSLDLERLRLAVIEAVQGNLEKALELCQNTLKNQDDVIREAEDLNQGMEATDLMVSMGRFWQGMDTLLTQLHNQAQMQRAGVTVEQLEELRWRPGLSLPDALGAMLARHMVDYLVQETGASAQEITAELVQLHANSQEPVHLVEQLLPGWVHPYSHELIRQSLPYYLAHLAGMNDHRERAQAIARRFHTTYERLAPKHSYQTRAASAVPWEQVPQHNRELMVAVVQELLLADVIHAGPHGLCVPGYGAASNEVSMDPLNQEKGA